MALVKRTVWPASTTARPSPMARCVLPRPAPKSRTFSVWLRNARWRARRAADRRRLELELEIVECLDRREVRNLRRHHDAGALFGVDFLPQDAVEKVEIGRLAARRVGEQRIQPIGDVAEAETRELLDDPGVDHDAHWPPPAMTAA